MIDYKTLYEDLKVEADILRNTLNRMQELLEHEGYPQTAEAISKIVIDFNTITGEHERLMNIKIEKS